MTSLQTPSPHSLHSREPRSDQAGIITSSIHNTQPNHSTLELVVFRKKLSVLFVILRTYSYIHDFQLNIDVK